MVKLNSNLFLICVHLLNSNYQGEMFMYTIVQLCTGAYRSAVTWFVSFCAQLDHNTEICISTVV